MAESTELVITREVHALRDLVWQAYTEPRHLDRWWGPKGMPTTTMRFEFKPGGMFLYRMQRPGGEWYGRFVYREIKPPEKLVYENSFCDDKGEVTRAPFPMKWPLKVLYTVTFTPVGSGTRIEVRGTPLNADEEEIKTFRDMHDNVTAGFNATIDQLEQHLKEHSMTAKNAGSTATKGE